MKINQDAIDKMLAARAHISSVSESLKAILELRVSQINGCAYCIHLHSDQARAAGEPQHRIDCLSAWREAGYFSDSERAALGWAEALTRLYETGAPDDAYEALREHFTDQQVVDITLIVSQMNAFNRIAVAFRQSPPSKP